MRTFRVILRLALLIAAGITIRDVPTSAQTSSSRETQSPAPQSQKLSGDDAKRAEELDKAIEAAVKADRWDEAIAKAEELLALRTRIQGPKHFETLNAEWRSKTLRRVASDADKKDRVAYHFAKNMNEQAQTSSPRGSTLRPSRSTSGAGDQPSTAHRRSPETAQPTAISVAVNLSFQGKYTQAQLLFEKALKICRHLLTDDHPDTGRCFDCLAMNLNAQGKYTQAQPLLEKALEIRRRMLTDDHPDTATSYNNVAFNLHAQGKYAQAQPLYEKALEIRRRLLTDDHPDTAASYNNVAWQSPGPREVRTGPAALREGAGDQTPPAH